MSIRDEFIGMVNNPQPVRPVRQPSAADILRVCTANCWLTEASERPDPVKLYDCFWQQGELCCLFADSNLGKSILAVQIGARIAERRNVIYFDFEMSDKQFQLRYTDPSTGNIITFPDRFMRAEIDPDSLMLTDAADIEDSIIEAIEELARRTDTKVIIVDNITFLNSVTEKGDAASSLMMKLMQLKRRSGLSVLILAHTPKRQLSAPITQNDLSGSKKLFNFFDSVFAVGRSAKDPDLRYIKQIKSRSGEFVHDASNVLVCEITHVRGMLCFSPIGTATEHSHLAQPSPSEEDMMRRQVTELHASGLSVREIATRTGKSKSAVGRILVASKQQ